MSFRAKLVAAIFLFFFAIIAVELVVATVGPLAFLLFAGAMVVGYYSRKQRTSNGGSHA